MENINWKDLTERARKGDQTAVNKLYSLTEQSSYFTAVTMMQNEDDAFDVMQNAYIKAFTKLDTLSQPEKFPGWVHQIVSNECKMMLRKRKDTLFSELETDSGNDFDATIISEVKEYSPDENMDLTETKRLVQEIINKLPEEQRLVVIMFFYQEMSIKEIAQALDCSENTVKSRLNYAKKKIKLETEELEKKGTKLYGITLLPLFFWLLRQIGNETAVPQSFSSGVCQAVSEAQSVSIKGDAVDKVASPSSANAVAKASFTLAEKVMSVVVAVSLVVCGGVFTKKYILNDSVKPNAPATSNESTIAQTTTKPVTTTEPYIDYFTQLGLTLSPQGDFNFDTWSEGGTVPLYCNVQISESTEGVEEGFKTVTAFITIDASYSELRWSFYFDAFDKYSGYLFSTSNGRVQSDIGGGYDAYVEFPHGKTGETISAGMKVTSEQKPYDGTGPNLAYTTVSITVPENYDGTVFTIGKSEGIADGEEYVGLRKISDEPGYNDGRFFFVAD